MIFPLYFDCSFVFVVLLLAVCVVFCFCGKGILTVHKRYLVYRSSRVNRNGMMINMHLFMNINNLLDYYVVFFLKGLLDG